MKKIREICCNSLIPLEEIDGTLGNERFRVLMIDIFKINYKYKNVKSFFNIIKFFRKPKL